MSAILVEPILYGFTSITLFLVSKFFYYLHSKTIHNKQILDSISLKIKELENEIILLKEKVEDIQETSSNNSETVTSGEISLMQKFLNDNYEFVN